MPFNKLKQLSNFSSLKLRYKSSNVTDEAYASTKVHSTGRYADMGKPRKVHKPNPEKWRKLFYFLCVPAIIGSMLNTLLTEVEHKKHYKRPEFRPFEYMRIRKKKWPWGDGNHSLFHNPYINALPTGYETDEDGNFLEDVIVKEDVSTDDTVLQDKPIETSVQE